MASRTSPDFKDPGRWIEAFFASDHAEIVAIVDEASRRRGAAAAAVLDLFHRRLERHAAWEESVLFPAAARAAARRAQEPAESMRREHRELRELIAVVRAGLDAGDEGAFVRRLADLRERLVRHNAAEEAALYRLCDEAIPRGEIDAILRLLETSPKD